MMEKNGILKKDIKICLPAYKIAYSLLAVVILSMVRGVVYVSEIGIAAEPPLALLAAVFCADTYTLEIQGKRNEIFRLCAPKRLTATVYRRLSIQMGYLWVLALAVYGCFYWQRPVVNFGGGAGSVQAALFGLYIPAILGTVFFWGILSNMLAMLFRNTWVGIGLSFILWIQLNSMWGDKVLGKWNVFSYTFRNIADTGDFNWICGKVLSVLLAAGMALCIPWLLRKRG